MVDVFIPRQGASGSADTEPPAEPQTSAVRFACVGDVHGQFELMIRTVETVNASLGLNNGAAGADDGPSVSSLPVSFVLQVGDMECHRHLIDLSSMAAPQAARHFGDFPAFAGESATRRFPWPVLFIGGNHECYGWLDSAGGGTCNAGAFDAEAADDAEPTAESPCVGHLLHAMIRRRSCRQLAPNFYYLGRAGHCAVRILHRDPHHQRHHLATLNLAFLSGIHRADKFYMKRPAATDKNFANLSNKEWIGFNCYDLERLTGERDWEQVDQALRAAGDELLLASRIVGVLGLPIEPVANAWYTSCCKRLLGKPDVMEVLARMAGGSCLKEKLEDLYRKEFGLGSAASSASAGDNDTGAGDSAGTSTDAARTGATAAVDSSSDADGTSTSANGAAASPDAVPFPHLLAFCLRKTAHLSGAQKRKLLSARFASEMPANPADGPVDVFLTHDWPAGPEIWQGERVRGSRPMGNEVAAEAMKLLRPTIHACGHMHFGHRAEVGHAVVDKNGGSADESATRGPAPACADGGSTGEDTTREAEPTSKATATASTQKTRVCCLAKMGLPHSVAIFEYDLKTGAVRELTPVPPLLTQKEVDEASEDSALEE